MIWTYIKYIRNPFTLVAGITVKFIFKNLLFKNLEWRDYNEFIRLTVDLIPTENWYSLCKLLMRVTFTPYNEVTQIDQISGILQHTTFNSNLKKTNKKIEEERQDKSWKIFFISAILGGLWKKFYFFTKSFILSFKIGTWLFMGGIVGIDVNKILHWFDFLRLNVPYWIYNKLVDVHINWLKLFKNVGQIDSISTKDLEEIKLKNSFKTEGHNTDSTNISNTENLTHKPQTYMGLDKTQWLIVLGISVGLLLICTGVYIKWYSDDSNGSTGSSESVADVSNLGGIKDIRSDLIKDLEEKAQVQKALDSAKSNITWTDYFKNKFYKIIPGKDSSSSLTEVNTSLEDSRIHEITIKDNTTNTGNTTGSNPSSTSDNGLGLKTTDDKTYWYESNKGEGGSNGLKSLTRPERKDFLLSRTNINPLFNNNSEESLFDNNVSSNTLPTIIERTENNSPISYPSSLNENTTPKATTNLLPEDNSILSTDSLPENKTPLASTQVLPENNSPLDSNSQLLPESSSNTPLTSNSNTPLASASLLQENTDTLTSTGSSGPTDNMDFLPRSRPLSPLPDQDLFGAFASDEFKTNF